MIRNELLSDGKVMKIRMPERLDFNVHKELRDAYTSNECETYRLDMSVTNYIDSAALGMILQIKEFAGDRNDSIVIEYANKNIKEILEVANFDKMMIVK